MMKKISRRAFLRASGLLAAAATLGSGLTGCSASSKEHKPITIMDAQRDYTALMDLVHEKYPEIQLEVQAYRGNNISAYMSKQLRTGHIPDIYSSTQAWNTDWQKEYLIDLSQYEVSDHYNEVRMNDTDVDGANYLIPYDYTITTIGYNKSLFERQGWAVPNSFAELQALAPQIKAAGVDLSISQFNLPGFGFQYFCNLSDTIFLNTVEGQQWQADFLAGTAHATDHLQKCKEYFQQWIDLGMLNDRHADLTKGECFNIFREGNTAFFIGGLGQFTENEDGSGDQYATMPFLSPDGEDNVYIVQTSRYYGLSKTLTEKGNEQKLEDALHFLEVLSTLDGFHTFTPISTATLCALQDFTLEADSVFAEALDMVNEGHSAPLIYNGWEAYLASMGSKVTEWVKGNATGDDLLALMDETQKEVRAAGGAHAYAEVTEELDNEQTTKLFGLIYLEATGADAALMSRNIWIEGVDANHENNLGVNGTMLPGALTEEDIVTNLPSGWGRTLHTLTLTGARIKEVAAEGFHYDESTDAFYPYTLLTRDGMELDDNTTYTVTYAGATDALLEEGQDTDTGILGLDAAKAYFEKAGTITPDLLK